VKGSDKPVDVARKKQVTYALVNSDTMEILSGVTDGAAVVVAGGNYLTDGSAVNVVKDEASQEEAEPTKKVH